MKPIDTFQNVDNSQVKNNRKRVRWKKEETWQKGFHSILENQL